MYTTIQCIRVRHSDGANAIYRMSNVFYFHKHVMKTFGSGALVNDQFTQRKDISVRIRRSEKESIACCVPITSAWQINYSYVVVNFGIYAVTIEGSVVR